MISQDIQEGKIAAGNQQLTREKAVEISSLEVFCCYAHEDQQLLNDLKAHLMPLHRQGLISLWADTDINAGAEWEKEIEKHLNTSQVILLLVSSDFMDSDYCYGKEMQRALDRHDRGEAQVIPIILRAVLWQEAPFGKLQALPKDAKPVIDWPNVDDALLDVVESICQIIEELRTNLEASLESKHHQERELSEAALQSSIKITKEQLNLSLRASVPSITAKRLRVIQPFIASFNIRKMLVHIGIIQLITIIMFVIAGIQTTQEAVTIIWFIPGTFALILGFTWSGTRVSKAIRWINLFFVAIGVIVITTSICFMLVPDRNLVLPFTVLLCFQVLIAMLIGGIIANNITHKKENTLTNSSASSL